ncbi:MAG TPA: hypothetical protein VF018_05610 [Acidobacteriaceae bacterium]
MTELWSILMGMFLGFVFGVGCALAVMYTIWTGGYKRAVEHSLMPEPPARFRAVREAMLRKQGHVS